MEDGSQCTKYLFSVCWCSYAWCPASLTLLPGLAIDTRGMKAIEWKEGDKKRKRADGKGKAQKQLKSPSRDQEQQDRYYPAGSPGSLEKADGRRRHASEVEIGLLLKEDPPRLKIVETQHTLTINGTASSKQDLADACSCKQGDKCWAVAMSRKPWPLRLHACNHHSEPDHASHDSPCHLLNVEQVKALRSSKEAAGMK